MEVLTSSSATSERLRREDFRRTKHDSAFSQWKILIGASDWEDHAVRKEGAERYRTQNLPNWISCPGVYELGVAASLLRSGREPRKLDSNNVVPVYLGQADNLRTRLQQYGREGAHLENGCSTEKYTNCQSVSSYKGTGLFTDIFSRGLSIVYRCAPMESKKDAEITEKQLLDKFDYAWNKGSNGARRPDDVCKKLDRVAKASQFSLLAKKLLVFNQKQVGIKIKTCEPCSWQNEPNLSHTSDNVMSSRTYGIRRLQPRQPKCGSGDLCTDICGVAIGHESMCTASPVLGRKRCAMHKGMRINGNISKLNAEGKLPPTASSMRADIIHSSDTSDNVIFSGIYGIRQLQPRQPQCGSIDSCTNICGVGIGHGSLCTAPPVPGRKRCALHKGMRINGNISKLNAEGELPPTAASMGSDILHGPHLADFQDWRLSHPHTGKHANMEILAPICGFILDNGSPCKRKPDKRNKRCLEHKGRRIRKS